MKKLHKPMSDFELQVLFDGFDQTFFNSRIRAKRGPIKALFVDSKKLAKANKDYAADASWRPGRNEIWIDKIYARSESMSCILLLHEMAHAVLEDSYVGHPSKNPGHGMIYQAELHRLFMIGAYDGLL